MNCHRLIQLGLALFAMVALRCAHASESDFYETKIRPALVEHCYRCHSADSKQLHGGLKVDSRTGLLRGGESGPAVIPGKPTDSLLIQALRHENGLAMPPEKLKLPEKVIGDFVTWVEKGALGLPDDGPLAAEGDELKQGRNHWAFQPIAKVELPAVKNQAWIQTPIDRFILAKLEAQGWQPAAGASRAELIRRVTFDLTGLPPTPEAIAEFVNDSAPEAYSRLIERLLASKHYGERMATHWLDVVRYAETEGYEYDRHIPDAWRYRDYVIAAFNSDKPYDQFIREQLAGDELAADNPEYRTAAIFHRLGPVRRNAGNPDISLSRNEVLTERTDIIGAAFMGLTIGCARCHNHKLEPILQKDYYRLQAYFAATEEHNVSLAGAEEQKEWETKTNKVKAALEKVKEQARSATGEKRAKLDAQIEMLEDQLPPHPPTIPSTRNVMQTRTAVHVLRRGVWENKGQAVGPRPLSVLVADDLPELPADVANPRTQLAEWLTRSDHPLTARVIVNRLWQQHFGVGLVKTANDFGVKGERPSHPELLDWLAARLVAEGWRLKSIQRLILLSSTYQQAGSNPAVGEQKERDPDNRLLSHFPRRRLSAEEIRDAMLVVSGRMNFKTGGKSVILPVDAELVQLLYKPLQWAVAKDATEHDRRSVYLLAKRNLRLPFLETLDAPALLTSCARREASTHAPQALELLNGKWSNDFAEAFAKRLQAESLSTSEQVVTRAFLLALGRLPTESERQRSVDFLKDQPLREFTLALFNLNEFLYVR